MLSIQAMRANFYRELDENLAEMAMPADVNGWLNDGRTRVRCEVPKTASLTWVKGDKLVALPADYAAFDSIEPPSGQYVPAYREWNRNLRFTSPDGAPSAGGATLFYGAVPPKFTGSADSVLPEVLDQACVSWALSRFYRRLASSRSDYRRYSTIAQGNAADVGQLLSEGDRHHADFMEAVDSWQMPSSVSFFGD